MSNKKSSIVKKIRLEPKHLAFALITKRSLDSWTRAKKRSQYDTFKNVQTTFVSIENLKEKAEQKEIYSDWFPPSVWQGSPGFMSDAWVNECYTERNKKEYNYKFGTGSYISAEYILLVDDLFEWVHGRREQKDVRSAFDIIIAVQKGELEL